MWAKYLVALSGSLTSDGGTRPGTSAKRKRLHILYLLNDLFHHTKYHLDSSAAFLTLIGSCQPYIVEVLGYAAAYDREKHPKHHHRLDELLDIWAEHGYYGADYVHKLREVVKNAAVSGPVKTSIGVEENNTDTANNQKSGKDIPFVMPSTHGDPSTPFYDLPAGNMVPHIIPNSTVPLRPDSIKPLQFLAGPADETLVNALKGFMKDVDQIYESGKLEPRDNDEVVDIDELGQPVIRDATTGEVLSGETYYGWSRGFCEQMKKRNNQTGRRSLSRSHSRSWSRSSSRSQSRSRSPSRRRYSDSPQRRSYSRSRSASPRRRRQASRSRERSYSPAEPGPGFSQGPGPGYTFQPPYQQLQFPSAAPPPPGPPPISQPPFPPHMYPGMIPPPPPPPNYQGTWPPPGMPMPPGMMMMNPMNMQFPSAAPPPPPGSGPGAGAFPSPLPLQGSHFPPVHGRAPGPAGWPGSSPGPGVGAGPRAQQLPPGSFRFPPPHSAGRGRGR